MVQTFELLAFYSWRERGFLISISMEFHMHMHVHVRPWACRIARSCVPESLPGQSVTIDTHGRVCAENTKK